MFNFSVRPAVSRDAASISKINKNFERMYLSPEETEEILKDIISDGTNIVLVAVHSGHIAGYISAKEIASLTEPRYIEIVNLGINAYYRDKGAGVALLRAVRKWAEQMTASKIIYSMKTQDEEKFIYSLEEDNYIKDERSMIFVRRV